MKTILANNPVPQGIRVELGGRYASQQEAFSALLLVLGLAVVSVMAVMVVQFKAFVEPLVVLLAAPLSFVGALALLLVTKTPLNVASFMGLILLVGLIVKNGIICSTSRVIAWKTTMPTSKPAFVMLRACDCVPFS